MSDPGEPDGAVGGVYLEATAYGQATVNQAGRDQHFHFSADARRVASAGDGTDGGCPFPGLASFTAEQAPWFFGRDRLTARLVGRLNGCLTGDGPVMVVAASGAGKSSLLRAGLLPKVAEGGLTPAGSRHWPRIVFTPGAHPVRAAAAALTAASPAACDTGATPDPGADDLDGLLAQAVEAAGPGARAVIVVDQFEELFRLCDDENERGAFISWLWQAARSQGPGGPAALVACAVRADFYPDCTRYPELSQALQDNQVIVGAMSADELRAVITCPAEAAGLDIEPGLPELLLADLQAGRSTQAGHGSVAADDGAGRLPLLAHALQATWQQRHGSTLTVDGYRTTGGIEHAIADSAEQVFARLDAAAQQETRGLFLRLVKIGDTSGEDIRRPAPRPGLAGTGGMTAAVIDAYTASRLLTQSRNTVQITHEALLRAWPRLAGWLDDDRAGQLMRQRIEDDAADWDDVRRDPSLLYRGARMQAAAVWAGGHSLDLTGTARQFLAVSRRRARRTGNILRSGVAILAVLAVATTITSVVALRQRSAAIRQRNLAVYNQVLAEASQLATVNPSAAAQLLVTAYRMRPSPELQSRLIGTENQSLPSLIPTSGPVNALAVTPDDRIIATLSDTGTGNGTITLWDISSSAQPRKIGQPLTSPSVPVNSVALSPDGRTLAAATYTDTGNGAITLWDVSNPARPQELGQATTADSTYVSSVAFSPNGRTLAAITTYGGTGNGVITLWDITRPAHPRELGRPLTLHGGSGAGLALFSPDGLTLAAATYTGTGNGGIALWDVSNPARPRELGQATIADSTYVSSLAFSPDGRTMASGSDDGTVTLWDITHPAHPRLLSPPLSAGSGSVVAVDFSPDRQTLDASSADGAVTLWNITHPAQPQELGQPANTGNTSVAAAAFSPDGQTLITGSQDGTIGVLPLRSSAVAVGVPVNAAVFSPDGRSIATANADGAVTLWDVSNPALPRESGQTASTGSIFVSSVAFSPDGLTLASVNDNNNSVTLWDIANPAHPRQIGQPLHDGSVGTDSVAFSPVDRVLATANADGSVTLWDIANPAHLRQIGQPLDSGDVNFMGSLAFSPDGRLLTGVVDDGTLVLWKITNPIAAIQEPGLPLTVVDVDSVSSVAFSPDSRTLAILTTTGIVTLWDVSNPADPRQIGQPLSDEGASMAYSPDGQTLAIASTDGTVTLWDVSGSAWPWQLGPALSTTGAVTAFVAFSPHGDTLMTISDGGTIQLWNLDVSYAINRICSTTTITGQQWRQYLPQLPYEPSCPQ
jgi:WD40 repeat protein